MDQGFPRAEMDKASEALRRMKKTGPEIENTPQMRELWCALRSAMKDGARADVRILASQLKDWKCSYFATASFEQSYLVAPNGDEQLATHKTVKECTMPPESFEHLPPNVGASSFYIMDKRAQRLVDLGDGVHEIRARMGIRKSKSVNPRALGNGAHARSSGDGSAAAPGGNDAGDKEGLRSEGQPAPAARGDGPPEAKRPRILERPPDTVKKLQDAVGMCATEFDAECERGNLVSSHALQSSAEFWMRNFVDNLSRQWREWKRVNNGGASLDDQDKFASQLDPFSKEFLPFSIRHLLARPCAEHLSAFTSLHKKIQVEIPKLSPALASVLIDLVDKGAGSIVDIDESNLELQEIADLHKSTLIAQIVEMRISGLLKAAQEDTAKADAVRLSAAKRLLAMRVEGRQRASLQVARTFFGPAYMSEKLIFLMGDPNHVGFFSEWKPSDGGILKYKGFCMVDGAFTTVTPSDFTNMAMRVVAAGDACAGKVKHVVAKDLLATMKMLFQAQVENKTVCLTKFAGFAPIFHPIFSRVAASKLELMAEDPEPPPACDLARSHPEAQAFLRRAAEVLGGSPRRLPGAAAEWLRGELAATKAKEEEGARKKEAEELAKQEQAKKEAAAAKKEPKEGPVKEEPAEAAGDGGEGGGEQDQEQAKKEAAVATAVKKEPAEADTPDKARAGGGAQSAGVAEIAAPGTANEKGEPGASADAWIQEGVLRITIAGNFKDKFHDKLAKVTKCNRNRFVTVEFLEGSEKGETKEFRKCKVKPTTRTSPTALKTSLACPEPEASASMTSQKESSAQRAANLFGKAVLRTGAWMRSRGRRSSECDAALMAER
ncbi:unnamed protein product, partial [Prorocentrum cordatum]